MQMTSYDRVGYYNQDDINGFNEGFIYQLIDFCKIKENDKVLDAMAGNGNLSEKILSVHPNCQLTTTDISKVQCDIARSKLGEKSTVIPLDFTEDPIFDGVYDVVVIKSGTHEIPLDKQRKLYRNIYKALKPGGHFVNLGILLPNPDLRKELTLHNRYRSTLAGLPDDITNRYFLTREEFYGFLNEEGYSDIKSMTQFNYEIDMSILAKEYFDDDTEKKLIIDGVMSNLNFFRKSNLATLDENWVLKIPGEISMARKPFNN